MSDITNQQVLDAVSAVASKQDKFSIKLDKFALRMDKFYRHQDQFDNKFNKFATKQDQLFAGVSETLQTITDNMVTKDELSEGLNALDTKLTARIDGVELRLTNLTDKVDIMGARLTAKIEENRADSIERYTCTLPARAAKK